LRVSVAAISERGGRPKRQFGDPAKRGGASFAALGNVEAKV